MPALLAEHPVVGVDFFDAVAFALWAGGSLPTELEWVEASGLPEHRAYVWGDAFDNARCNTVRSGRRGTSPVGAYPGGVAPSGCADLCGNVWELTCSADPRQPDTVLVKGGSWYDFPCHARIDTSFNARVHKASSTVGFRLVYGRGPRLPAFLDTKRLAGSIADRRAVPTDEEAARVRNEIAGRADDPCAALKDAAPLWNEALPVEEALRALEPVGPTPATVVEAGANGPPGKSQNSHSVRTIAYAARMAAWFGNGIQRHPHAAGASLLAAAALVVGLLWATARAETTHGRTARAPLEQVAKPPLPLAPTPPESPRPEDRVASAVKACGGKDAEARDAAERYLIAHAALSEGPVGQALAKARSVGERASLQYVLVAIEDERSPVSRPLVLRRPPTQGLVLFLRGIDADTVPLIALLRRTARAERTPFTVVHGGGRPAEEVVDLHALQLGAVSLFCDDDGEFAHRCGLEDTPLAVVGLRADAQVAFVHRGAMARSVLSERARGLR